MELVSSWELAAPYLVVDQSIAPHAGDAARAALSARAAEVPWTLGSRGRTLRLAVGPVAFEPGALEPALELFHHYRQSLAFNLPADTARAPRSGFGLVLPYGELRGDRLRGVAEVVAPLVSPLLASVALPSLRLERDGSSLVATFGQSLLPGIYDAVVPVLGAVLLALVRGAGSAGLRGDLERRSELVSAADGVVEVLQQRDAVRPGQATRLWRDCDGMLECFVPRGHLDAARRTLQELGALALTSEPLSTEERRSNQDATPLSAEHAEAGLLAIVPFRPGARPIDEVIEKGTGASEAIGFLKSGAESPDHEDSGIWILFRLGALQGDLHDEDIHVTMSASFLPPEGETGDPVRVPGLQGIDVPARVVAAAPNWRPVLMAANYRAGDGQVYVASLAPQSQLLPGHASAGRAYRWEDLDGALRARCPDGEDPFTFAAFFNQRVDVELALSARGEVLATSTTTVEVYDTERFGSLYARLLRLVAEDTARQAAAFGASEIYAAHHPWYPVLAIGMNKADLYTRAIHQDLAQQSKHLANPRWLLRVGLYLEYLTCVGIFEAVRDEYPSLLSPVERKYYLESPRFEEIRRRIDVARWREVWKLHPILEKGKHPISAGPVAYTNLLAKQKSTLAFLHAHHADLEHAIELTGPNLESSQESWQRVYRDAERAVVTSSLAAFPELSHVPPRYRDFCLWHVKGEFAEVAGVAGAVLPAALTEAFGDQDGVYASGARQYRASMNGVAERAREKGLMDYAGKECIPRSASLIEALLDEDDERFAALQARDGYAGSLEAVSHTLTIRPRVNRETVSGLLRGLEIFSALDDAEIEALAGKVRRISTVPTEEVVVEGQEGTSLFVVESGHLEAVKQGPGGERRLGRLRAGSVFGEMALLTGEPRSATIRSIDYASLIEIPKEALEPIFDRRPRILDALSDLLATRSQTVRPGASGTSRASLVDRMVRFAFGKSRSNEPITRTRTPEELVPLLKTVRIFRPLSEAELRRLAEYATVTTHGAGSPIVAQGERGSSVFIVETGQVEVVAVQRDGKEAVLALLGRSGVFGEMALLTGERRSATVRAVEGSATVVEISKSDLLPFISQRPPLIIQISELLTARQAETRALTSTRREGASLARRMSSFFLG